MDVAELPEHREDFWNACIAEGLAVRTADAYARSVGMLHEWAQENGYETVDRRTITAFFAHLQTADAKPAYNVVNPPGRKLSAAYIVHVRTGLRTFNKWAQEENLTEVEFMKNIRRPKIKESPVPVLSDSDLKKLVAACRNGKDGPPRTRFASVRDTAILRVLIDCGLRREELANLRLDEIDFDTRLITVRGKGGKIRQVPFGTKTYAALRAYLKARGNHSKSETTPKMFLSPFGGMRTNAVNYVVEHRRKQARLPHIHPHQFRHTLAHRWLREGLDGTALMRIMGWSSPAMLQVYGRSGTTERAHHVHRAAGLGDKV